jgi:diguanylate cyclase (GGDEF)-like protein
VAPRLVTGGVPARLRAVLTEAPDHYELLDRRLVGRLAGFLFCAAGFIACVLLILEPPTVAIGGRGWLPAAVITALAFVFGAAMVVNTRVLGTGLLLAIGLTGPVMVGTLQWLAGSSPAYVELLILSVVWSGMVLPAPRLLLVMTADSLVVLLPAAYGRWDAAVLPQRAATLGIMWTLAVGCLVFTARNRHMRRILNAQREAADFLARVDALTGLGNRRALDEALAVHVALAARSGRPLAALVGDLDRFKAINDVHGHHAGDRLLCDVAAVLRDVVRTPDACFRWGGDEFVVLLAEATADEAREVAVRVSEAIRARIAAPDGAPVLLSLGVAGHAPGDTGADLLAAADADLLGHKPHDRAATL